MNGCQVKDFGSVQVYNPRHGTLVQQSNLDGAATFAEPLFQISSRERQRIGAQCSGTQAVVELFFGEQSHGAEAAAVPIPDALDWPAIEIQAKAEMLGGRRIGDQD